MAAPTIAKCHRHSGGCVCLQLRQQAKLNGLVNSFPICEIIMAQALHLKPDDEFVRVHHSDAN